MPRKWGEGDEAANYAAMDKRRRKASMILAVVLGLIIGGSLILMLVYWMY